MILQRRRFHVAACSGVLSLIVSCFIFTFTASAQTSLTAALRGQVTVQRTGETIANARVQVASATLQFARETTTDEDGRYTFANLSPAVDYQVTVEVEGFVDVAPVTFALATSETSNADFKLVVQGFAETVDITDATSLVTSDAPEVSQTVDRRRILELPSNSRNVNRFALLNPHVRNTAGQASDGSGAARLSINAQSFRHTFYKLDGNTNYDSVFANAPQQQVSITAVQEFKVLTNQYSAEHGSSTAGIISTVTRAGTKDFRGEGFFFSRPSGIQAAPPVSTLRAPNQLVQFGGAISGPLFGERTTFFANFENARQERGAFIQKPVPLVFTGHFRDYLGLVRLDHDFNDEHSLTFRLNANRNGNDNPNDRVSNFTQPSAAQKSRAQSTGAQLTDRQIFGTLINEARASYINTIPSATSALFPSISVVRPNVSTEGGSTYSWVRSETFQFADQVAVQLGAHDLKFGGEFTRQRVADFSVTPFGEYRFSATTPNAAFPQEYTQRFGTGFIRYAQTLASLFAQDNIRVNPRLTLNLGLRYDHQSITDDRNNFAPRLGFAYDIGGDGKTIVRGGAGIFYDQYYMYITRRFLLEGVDAPVRSYRFTYNAAGAPSTPGAPAFPDSLLAPPTSAIESTRDYVYLPGEKLLNPYSTQFSVGIQRRIFGDMTATADIIHQRTLKQMQVRDANAPAPFIRTNANQSRTVAAADATRPFGTNYNGVPVRKVIFIENTASSSYDALDLGLLRRFANRYQFEAHYVYSSALTDAMFFGEADTGVAQELSIGERAPSDFHQRHRFVGHALAQLPLNSQLSVVATLASGLPVNPVTGDDTNADGYRADRPFGFGRNSFRTPAQISFDASLSKRFDIGESTRIELRAEGFNVFNHTNYIRLNNIYGNAATPRATFLAGQPGAANSDPGRQLQFGARFIF